MRALDAALDGGDEVVEDVVGEEFAADAVAGGEEVCAGEEGEAGCQGAEAEAARDADAALGGAFVFDSEDDAPDDAGQVDDEHGGDGNFQIAKQFGGLAEVGGGHVQEHVDGDDALAVEVEQDNLEGAEHHEGDEPQDGASDLAAEAHEQQVDAQGEGDVAEFGPHGVELGEAQGDVGHEQGQGHDEHHGGWREDAAQEACELVFQRFGIAGLCFFVVCHCAGYCHAGGVGPGISGCKGTQFRPQKRVAAEKGVAGRSIFNLH